jgi:hypothetical protein
MHRVQYISGGNYSFVRRVKNVAMYEVDYMLERMWHVLVNSLLGVGKGSMGRRQANHKHF